MRATPSLTPSWPNSDEQPRRRAPCIAGAFTTTVEATAVELWDQPAPPEGWVARDVVRHLVEWFPAFLDERPGSRCRRVRRSTTTPSAPGVPRPTPCRHCSTTRSPPTVLRHHLPHIGRMPLGQAIDMIYTGDVFLHRWDLAQRLARTTRCTPISVPPCWKACCRWTRCCARAASTGPCRCSRRHRRPDQAAALYRTHTETSAATCPRPTTAAGLVLYLRYPDAPRLTLLQPRRE